MFDKKIKNVADAVMAVMGLSEEIDSNTRTKDTTKGQEPTKQKDDVGPGSDGKSTKVKYRAGPMLSKEDFKERLIKSLEEASEDMLARYMNSRGYNPSTTPKDKKIAITKSNEFKKWLNDHQFEETGYDSQDYSDEELTEMVNEVLSKDASAGDWIHDFVHSDNPKFKGKSQEKRKKMALAAYYAHHKEEVELEEGKRPEGDDSPPWTGGSEPAHADVKDKGTGGTHTPMSRVRHLARMGLKKVKTEVLGKAGTTSEEVELSEKINAGTLDDLIKSHGFHKTSKAVQKMYDDGHIDKKQADSHMNYLNKHHDKVGSAHYAVEEVEQVNEISSGLASRYLSKKRDRDYKSTGTHSSERKEPQTIDQAMKDGKNTVRALRIIQKKKAK